MTGKPNRANETPWHKKMTEEPEFATWVSFGLVLGVALDNIPMGLGLGLVAAFLEVRGRDSRGKADNK